MRQIGRGEGLCRVCQRQRHGKFEQGASAGCAFERNTAVHALDDAFGNGETETRTRLVLSPRGLLELTEDAFVLGRSDADAGVAQACLLYTSDAADEL